MSSALPVATRRRTLAALAATAGAATTGGCLNRLRNVAGRDPGERVSVDIKAAPADTDPMAIAIARRLAGHLEEAGIAVRVTPVSVEELRRQVLINHDFDLYVGRYPGTDVIDPDELYPLLHSKFTNEAGWQNPFGCTDLRIDELLERQRTTSGGRRRTAIRRLQEALVKLNPFFVVAFPDDLSAVRVGEYEWWTGVAGGFDTSMGLLALDRVEARDGAAVTPTAGGSVATNGSASPRQTRLSLATTDGRITQNRNPIAAEFRDAGVFTGLLYDPLARPVDDEPLPWMAEAWAWNAGLDVDGGTATPTPGAANATSTPATGTATANGTRTPVGTPTATDDGSTTGTAADANATGTATGDGSATAGVGTGTPATERTTNTPDTSGLSATVRLRDGLRWHDGKPITAADVAFTYEFLKDTSMGGLESPVPAPRFRGRSSLVDTAWVRDRRTVSFQFATSNPAVAVRAFTVPVLPEHVWSERTQEVKVPGIGTDGVTEALVWVNPKPVGSGPLVFEEATAGESARFSRYADHFLATDPPANLPEWLHGKPAFDELVVNGAPSDSVAVELAAAGDVDATVSQLSPSTVPNIGRSPVLRLVSTRSWSFYHVGFNMRRPPLSNPHFRSAVSHMLDSGTVASKLFGGYAHPAVTPLAGTRWEAPSLAWDERTRDAQFHGTDGKLDVERAMEAFRQAGYRYDEEGRLRA